MAGRIRSQRPEVLADAPNASLSDLAWRLKTSIPLLADDAGRAPATPGYLGGQALWARPRPDSEIESALVELEAAGQIRRYVVNGVPYLVIVGWADREHVNYQRLEKPSPPRFPSPPETSADTSPSVPVVLPEFSGNVPGGIRIRKGSGREEEVDVEPSALKTRAPRRKPRTALPVDWSPRPEDTHLAGEQLARQLSRFRDHAIATDRRQVDWDAAWRMWQSKAAEFAQPIAQRKPPASRRMTPAVMELSIGGRTINLLDDEGGTP